MTANVSFCHQERRVIVAVSFVSGHPFEDASCAKCGGSKPTCCSCPPPTLSQQAQKLVDEWLIERRLLDQAFITIQDRENLVERITRYGCRVIEPAKDMLNVTISVGLIEEILDEMEQAGSPKISYQPDLNKMRAEAEVIGRAHLVTAFTLLRDLSPLLRGRNRCSACGRYIVGVYSHHVCPP